MKRRSFSPRDRKPPAPPPDPVGLLIPFESVTLPTGTQATQSVSASAMEAGLAEGAIHGRGIVQEKGGSTILSTESRARHLLFVCRKTPRTTQPLD
jgi:hypothetical protein